MNSCSHRPSGVEDFDAILHWGSSIFGQKGSSGLFLSTQVPERREEWGRITHCNIRWLQKLLMWSVSPLIPTRQIQVPLFYLVLFYNNYDHFLNRWHLLYVWCDVILCPFLSECEEVVKALQRILGEILHPQQANGLWSGGAVHQGDALKGLERRQHCGQFLKMCQ